MLLVGRVNKCEERLWGPVDVPGKAPGLHAACHTRTSRGVHITFGQCGFDTARCLSHKLYLLKYA